MFSHVKGKGMTIYFYSDRENPYGCFSNFSRHGFELDGVYWPTSEHYFQAQKFAGTPADQIRQVKTPKDAARLGREALMRRFANTPVLSVPIGNKSKTTSCGKQYCANLKPMPTSARCYYLHSKEDC